MYWLNSSVVPNRIMIRDNEDEKSAQHFSDCGTVPCSIEDKEKYSWLY